LVRKAYTSTLGGASSCCTTGINPNISGLKVGYSQDDLKQANSVMLGCGNPVSFANLQPGEDVVDLGCGAGLDCFLAQEQVGADGSVIGIDMTPEMLEAAQRKAKELNLQNVEFRQGEIESLPIGSDSIDAIISNCVINLSPDKAKVYSEAFRVLRAGGRLCVSDVVATDILPEALRTEQALAC
jgi:ubiquinone/menaquinone biosynthesis C-methylase UbiE